MSLIRAVRTRHPLMPAVLLTGYAGDSVTTAAATPTGGPFAVMRKPSPGAEMAARILLLLAEG